ncbi:MAG: DUF1800 domain-containing protein [Granulosicoccaceae bacterium]
MINASRILLPVTLVLLASCGGGGGGSSINVPPAASPALPATEVANAAADGPLSEREAFRLLQQSTFGPKLDDVKAVAAMGPEAWINQQMALPGTQLRPTLLSSRYDRWNEYVNSWWRNAIQADDQLRQRVAFALSQILVVSGANGLGQEQEGLTAYYDILVRHSFGNYRELLEEVTLNPVMGEYLSMKGNQKPNLDKNIRPDENYARELLQLFTIGLSQLNPDGTEKLDAEGVPIPAYNQTHVEAFAHVFTGWHFANADDFRWPSNEDFINPMLAWPEYHDMGEKKLILGKVLPAGQSAEEDLKAALDTIFIHPNVGPFISKQLIQRLVTSNPTPGYVRDVAAVFNKNINGERGNLASTVKAILMHSEARTGHLENPSTFGKTKEPLLRMTQLWRAFPPDVIHRDFNYAWATDELQQAPLRSPTVFNFFRPEFSQPGEIADSGMVSPELQILDENSIITITSRLAASVLYSNNYNSNPNTKRITINIDREMQLEPDPDALIEHLNNVLLGGQMSEGLKQEVQLLMASRTNKNSASLRVVEAIFLIVSSPESSVQI